MNTTTPPTRHPFKAQADSALCAICGLSRLTVRHSTMGQNFDLLAEKERRARRRAKTDSARLVHERVLAGIRQLVAEKATKARLARLAEIEAYGRTRGWNE